MIGKKLYLYLTVLRLEYFPYQDPYSGPPGQVSRILHTQFTPLLVSYIIAQVNGLVTL